MRIIRVEREIIKKIENIIIEGYNGNEKNVNAKIAAIKALRSSPQFETFIPNGNGEMMKTSTLGLRESKEAIEELIEKLKSEGKINVSNNSTNVTTGSTHNVAPVCRIVALNPIKKIIVDMGCGDVEIDFNGLSLEFMSQMGKLPIEEISSLIDLYKLIENWTEAQKQKNSTRS